jgi:hypothetical protein
MGHVILVIGTVKVHSQHGLTVVVEIDGVLGAVLRSAEGGQEQ